jgi:hypothetical protein
MSLGRAEWFRQELKKQRFLTPFGLPLAQRRDDPCDLFDFGDVTVSD